MWLISPLPTDFTIMATCNEPEIIEEAYIPPFSILIKDTDGIENDSKTEIAVSKGELMIRIPESERAPGLGGDPPITTSYMKTHWLLFMTMVRWYNRLKGIRLAFL